ncbi:beta-ketoacyl synthase N-terminal-like domain-containing protein [Aureibaculum sp. 2210JD6-5]|uniref:beta-ketoacyl synthase N-terminal-like domain-containing protein n=1 Tax=Aureibaculum sp. 2210JD6-5 TaxID=3103957 RepID=UPI002AAD7CC6|nr:beta-ketoacyl synthase N-terminal-like domain-containing protein [Aureibaculum sp. 2210JD6-5]MDY7393867.1 beta-ketoacyl synthase N-terminal-like domain-containing protein [Aureibaculum sp. 2210JD6-5]
MKPCYINGLGCVSAQNTTGNQFLEDIAVYETNILPVINPNYKDYIPPAAARRMAKGVKMGVVASALALKEAGVKVPDAIITGTGMGCVQDSEKFVSAVIDNDEQFLTPTSFIQSTHNTVGAQIALGLQCKAYNFTYVHAAVSFESCLLDAQLMFNENEASNILVGGIDEHGEHTNVLHQLIGHIKKEEVGNTDLINSNTEGTIFGEGAVFFSLSDKKNENSYAKLADVEIFSRLNRDELETQINKFLERNNLSVDTLDAVVLGNNGDIDFDAYYKNLQEGIFKGTQQIYYKHLCGEFNTASSFGCWVASNILKQQDIPEIIKINNIGSKSYKNVLLYNQYRGENHSLVLLQSC